MVDDGPNEEEEEMGKKRAVWPEGGPEPKGPYSPAVTFGAMNELYKDCFAPVYPARSTVQAPHLPWISGSRSR